jgi:hypothetical protein
MAGFGWGVRRPKVLRVLVVIVYNHVPRASPESASVPRWWILLISECPSGQHRTAALWRVPLSKG